MPAKIKQSPIRPDDTSNSEGNSSGTAISSAPKKSREIITIKAFAIIGVVFHHIANRRFPEDVQNSINILPLLFSWAVLTFIGTAGWLHASSAKRGTKNIGDFVLLRAQRLLAPYLILTISYSVIWQLLHFAVGDKVGTRLPSTFWEKLWGSLSLGGEPVGEQLYFFPLLFLISVGVHATLTIAGRWGVAVLGLITLAIGLILWPQAANTGFSPAVLCFGSFSYAAGYVMYDYRARALRHIAVLVCTVVMLSFMGYAAIPKVLALIIIATPQLFTCLSSRLTDLVGEASGTVFAYHTPFIIQPLIIATTFLPPAFWIPGALASALASIALCTMLYHGAKGTSFKKLLV